MSGEVKKVSATLVPQPEASPRPFSRVELFLGSGKNASAAPPNHPLAAARIALQQAEAERAQAALEFQRELQLSVRLQKLEPAWICGKLSCEGKMEMRDAVLVCQVCGRRCAPGDASLKFRQFPAETILTEGAAERIRAKRKAYERAEAARDLARRHLVEGAGELNLELAAESRAQRNKQ